MRRRFPSLALVVANGSLVARMTRIAGSIAAGMLLLTLVVVWFAGW